MKIAGIATCAVVALGLAVGTASFTDMSAQAADPHEFKGKIDKIEREGRVLHINGKEYRVSGSRSNVCIKGSCDQDRANLKAGMECAGNTSSKKSGMEVAKVSCK